MYRAISSTRLFRSFKGILVVLVDSCICWVTNCAQIGGGAAVAELGGVRFSLSFFRGGSSGLEPFDDFGLDSKAERLVDDFDFFMVLTSCFSGDFGFGVLDFSFPIKDLRETELFVFLYSSVLLTLSPCLSIDFLGDERMLSLLPLCSLKWYLS